MRHSYKSGVEKGGASEVKLKLFFLFLCSLATEADGNVNSFWNYLIIKYWWNICLDISVCTTGNCTFLQVWPLHHLFLVVLLLLYLPVTTVTMFQLMCSRLLMPLYPLPSLQSGFLLVQSVLYHVELWCIWHNPSKNKESCDVESSFRALFMQLA